MTEDEDRVWFRGEHYLRFGYRVRPMSSSRKKARHFIGGKPHHANAVCRNCRRPLLLLWDIDCTDPALKRETRPIFGGLKRLPLYYCWTCSSWLAYRVESPDKIVMVARDEEASFQEDWPYPEYPEELPRIGVELEPLPPDIEKICLVGDQVGDDWLNEDDRRRFAEWAGRPKSFSLLRQQLGGLPYLAQDHEQHRCPNKKCRWPKKYANWRYGWMKELATIHNDPENGLPLIEPAGTEHANEYVQVVFWICRGCLTIRADQRSA